MISDKLKNMRTTLSLVMDGKLELNRGVAKSLRRQLIGIEDEVRELERAAVPKQARITPDQVDGTNVRFLYRSEPFQ